MHTREKSTHRGWVTAAILLSMFMTAIEITIVATAMPRIVSELGGFAFLSWVFSSYLLTQVVSIPIYGKLADLYGRKPVFTCGVVIFLISSVLCGLATSMTQLILFRFLQGIGGGAVQPIGATMIGDLYQPHERHKVQGYTGSVFAISSLVGPALGAFIVELGHWSWIFYLNVPLGLGALFILHMYLHEEKHPRKHRLDFGGALLMVIGISVLMLALLEGGTVWPWISWQTAACLFVFACFFAALLWVESKVKEPILPLWIFKHPLIVVAGIATFLNGALMIGYSAMIPTHVQGVLGQSAIAGGLALSAMSIGWPLASYFSGRVILKTGYKKAAIGGAFALLLGTLGVLLFGHTTAVFVAMPIFLVGVGLGIQSNAYVITIQSSVPWNERGVATANNIFMRTLGSSVGVAAFGGVLNSTITGKLKGLDVGGASEHGVDSVNKLLSASSTMPAGDREAIVSALSSGMNSVFIAASILALAGLVVTFALPTNVKARR